MVLSKSNIGWETSIEDFLRLKHCGVFKENGLREYLVSKGVRHYPTFYFKVDSQYEEVSKDDIYYDATYPCRLKSMKIALGSTRNYYYEEWEELNEPGFYSGLINYFEGKCYPLKAFMQHGGCDDAEKIDQFFRAMIRDGFKICCFKFVEPSE